MDFRNPKESAARFGPPRPVLQSSQWSDDLFDSDNDDRFTSPDRPCQDGRLSRKSFQYDYSQSDSENVDKNCQRRSRNVFKTTESTIEKDVSTGKSATASKGLIGTVRLLQSQVSIPDSVSVNDSIHEILPLDQVVNLKQQLQEAQQTIDEISSANEQLTSQRHRECTQTLLPLR
jgi:hypothetical protein